MAHGFLKETLLDAFLETLRSFGELHGPTVTDQAVPAFAPLTAATPLQLDYQRTQIPPKKYLLPFREEILQYRDGVYDETQPQSPPIVLFGVHPCDLEAIAYLDLVFLGNERDPSYARRREGLTLIGISCEPDDYCFCPAPVEGGRCDIFLARRDGGYLLTASSARGEEIAAAAGSLFVPAPAAMVTVTPPGAAICTMPPQDPELRFSGNPLWEDFAARCVSCGACSVCCPTCYCFDVREYPQLGGGGIRLREWDNCLFATHGEVAGANFRPGRLDRLRYRYLHKYCGFSPLAGMSSCVGCGRCKKACPVDIDLRELLPPKEVAR